MPSWEAWVERPNGIIKRGDEAQALKVGLQNDLIQVENILRE
jgi:hypothetical protein